MKKVTRPHLAYKDMAMLPVHFAFTTNEQAFQREMRRLGVEEPMTLVGRSAQAMTYSFETAAGESLIIVTLDRSKLPRRPDKVALTALLAHEAVHVWQRCKEAIGEDTPGTEMEAYTIQWLTRMMAAMFEEGK